MSSGLPLMAFGYIKDDKLIVFTQHKELGYGKGKQGNWWALRAFGAICEAEERLPYPLTKWEFPLELELAVERILKARQREFQLVSEEECAKMIKEILG